MIAREFASYNVRVALQAGLYDDMAQHLLSLIKVSSLSGHS